MASNFVKISSKNFAKNHIEFKVGFRNIYLCIFDSFQFDFGQILAPKWPEFCCRKSRRKPYQAQTGLQRSSDPHLGPFWKRFGSIFEQLFGKFGQLFTPNFRQCHICTNINRKQVITRAPDRFRSYALVIWNENFGAHRFFYLKHKAYHSSSCRPFQKLCISDLERKIRRASFLRQRQNKS